MRVGALQEWTWDVWYLFVGSKYKEEKLYYYGGPYIIVNRTSICMYGIDKNLPGMYIFTYFY